MPEIKFDDDDIRQLRERLAQAKCQSPAPLVNETKPASDVGLVQLNVRVRPDVKHLLVRLAREQGASHAEVIAKALLALEQGAIR